MLHPSYVTLECAYGIDGATYHLDDPAHPGCTQTFCDSADWKCGFSGYPPQAWAPADLKVLLDAHADHGARYHKPGFHSGYNELILNSPKINEHLPHSIMGFFFIKGQSTITNDLGYGIVIDMVQTHQAFLRSFEVSKEQVPLLVLDPSNWDAPFAPYKYR